MDPRDQRLIVAQDFTGQLLQFLQLPIKPPRETIQAAIDAANARLAVIAAQEAQPPATPLVGPTFVPPAPPPATPATGT